MFILFRSHQSNFVLFPPKLEGCTVVDRGCGVGRDVFILSKLVGENGRVIGIDSDKDHVKIFFFCISYRLQSLNKFNFSSIIDQRTKFICEC